MGLVSNTGFRSGLGILLNSGLGLWLELGLGWDWG